jgi:aldehyde:ferredoxin oxidoreductase
MVVGVDGGMGRVLVVDLTSGRSEVWEPGGDGLLGGRALAASLAWDLLRPGLDAFDPANPLMFLGGPLSGTRAPAAGRTTVCSLSPQGSPHPWFSRSSMGGDLGHALRGAGYCGVVCLGRAPRPVVLHVSEEGARLEETGDLWGRGIMATQQALRGGRRDARVAAIGQAGETLSRIASIGINEGSAAGQCGFGAVMGSKNLKAVVAHGDAPRPIADPEGLRALLVALAREHTEDRERRAGGSGRSGLPAQGKPAPCSRGCLVACAMRFEGVRGVVFPDREYAGVAQCCSYRYAGGEDLPWHLGFAGGLELNVLANDWGINHWDVVKGLFVWIGMCHAAGLLPAIDGRAVEPESPRFWYEVLQAIATRRGPLAEVVADGGWRAIERTGLLPEEARQLYTGWGYANHWDGRGPHGNYIPYPFWLASALMWATDTRDPMGSAHGYVQNLTLISPLRQNALSWEQLQGLAERYYGDARAADPYANAEGKAEAALFSVRRSLIKDSLPLCDRVFPRLFTTTTPDGMPRVGGVEGPDLEAAILRLTTGRDVSTADLVAAADRALALERAEQVRDFGRSRAAEQPVLDFFVETEEERPSEVLGVKRGTDRATLEGLMRRFYSLRGWDAEA